MARTVRILSDGSITNAGAKMAIDGAGFASFLQAPEATELLQLDWTGYLGGETISTSAWEAGNLATAGAANTNGVTSVRVSAVPEWSYGYAKNTITTSGSRIATREVRFYGRKV